MNENYLSVGAFGPNQLKMWSRVLYLNGLTYMIDIDTSYEEPVYSLHIKLRDDILESKLKSEFEQKCKENSILVY